MTSKLISVLVLLQALSTARVVAGDETDTIPAGTNLDIRLKTTISTKHNRTGDLFTAEIEHPVLSGNVEIVTVGSAVNGHLEKVQKAEHNHKSGMLLVIDTIAGRSGMVYKLSPESSRLTLVRFSGCKPRDAACGKQAPPLLEAADLPPGARVVLIPHYQESVLYPGSELTFLVKQSVAATKVPATD